MAVLFMPMEKCIKENFMMTKLMDKVSIINLMDPFTMGDGLMINSMVMVLKFIQTDRRLKGNFIRDIKKEKENSNGTIKPIMLGISNKI